MKRGPYSLYLLIFLTLSISVSAQKKLGDENYARYNYRAAINCYLKAISSNPKDTSSLIHLANCYGILRDYDNAEIYYARAVTIPNIPASVFLNYGKILKNNGKIDEARAQFVTYSNLVPTDMAVKDEIRYCDNLKKKLYITYQVNTIDGINTKYSEFGPVLFKDNLVFVSDRGENMVEFDKSGTTGGNYFKIFTARPSANSFTKPEGFSSSINGVN
ncbi:MAG TPA: hypothetical protein VNY36_00975, partial [Bacteroidia bacterium]|nr:hypothetical protein [Bacteroidia bacterium]